MAVNWPKELPQFVDQDGFSTRLQDPVIRTEMDAGPKKTRLRYTFVPEQFDISLTLTKKQFLLFKDTFFKVDLGYGVSEFNWKHPVNQASAVCRFTNMYQASAQGLDFLVTIGMEIIS